MSRPLVLSHAERGLQHRNGTCAICRQRWEDGDNTGIKEQDGLYVCPANCFEPNGGVIERENERARAKELGAILTAKEMRPPVYPTPLDGRASAQSWISVFSARPLLLIAGGSAAPLVLTGGFRSTDTITYDDVAISNASTAIATSAVTLSVQAGALAVKGLHTLMLDGEPYRDCIDVR